MHLYKQSSSIPTQFMYFVAALMLFTLFVLYAAIIFSGILLHSTMQIEQWLLFRPLTQVDCVFFQWKRFGEVPFSLFLTLLLGICCILLGYRLRVLPLLFLLMALCVTTEIVGKQLLPQAVPHSIQGGMSTLACPQMLRQSRTAKVMVTLGMLWEAPPSSAKRIRTEQRAATASIAFDNASNNYGYPSGHAIRWMFLGLIASWLARRHIKQRLLKATFFVAALLVAFGGGFILFYTGGHLVSDLLAGYLVGASWACCAIGFLIINDKREARNSPQSQFKEDEASNLFALEGKK